MHPKNTCDDHCRSYAVEQCSNLEKKDKFMSWKLCLRKVHSQEKFIFEKILCLRKVSFLEIMFDSLTLDYKLQPPIDKLTGKQTTRFNNEHPNQLSDYQINQINFEKENWLGKAWRLKTNQLEHPDV